MVGAIASTFGQRIMEFIQLLIIILTVGAIGLVVVPVSYALSQIRKRQLSAETEADANRWVEPVLSPMVPSSERPEDQKSLPPLSEDLHRTSSEAVAWCRSQISDHYNKPLEQLPELGPDHDTMVGAYICGFIQGHVLTTGALAAWAGGDEAVEMIGFFALAVASLTSILGPGRSLIVQKRLPQIGGTSMTDGINLLDRVGGDDGINHARGWPKQFGGGLRHYLVHNVTEGVRGFA